MKLCIVIRIPAKPKLAKEVTPKDKRIKVYGTVVSISKDDRKLVIDDGSGSIGVFLNQLSLIEKLDQYQPGDQMMAIGWANPAGGVDGEIIRRIRQFDPVRYKQILEVCNSVSGSDEGPEGPSRSD